MSQTTKHSTAERGIKGRMEDLLKGRAEAEDAAKQPRTGLTLGEIGGAIGLDKTRHAELTSALRKSRDEGKVRFDTGPRTGNLGPRFVKRYRWVGKVVVSVVPVIASDSELRRSLAQMR